MWDNVRDSYQIQYIIVNIIITINETMKHNRWFRTLIFIAQTITGQQISLKINHA